MNEFFMKKAIEEAQKSFSIYEVPVGAIIVKDNKIVCSAHNTKERDNSALCHAEINAIKEASAILNTWRLSDCDMYVTLEPCVMCAGAILNSRIKNLYFGAYDFKSGSCGTNENIFYTNKALCHTTIYGGILENECKKILSDFFEKIR